MFRLWRRRRAYFISYARTGPCGFGYSNLMFERDRPIRTAEDIDGLVASIEQANPGHRDVVILFWRPLER